MGNENTNVNISFLKVMAGKAHKDIYSKKEFLTGNVKLDFTGYESLLNEYASLQPEEFKKAWELSRGFNLWGVMFSTLASLNEKLIEDKTSFNIKLENQISSTVKTATEGKALANKDESLVLARKEKNLLSAFNSLLESQIDFCAKSHHHCKNSCRWNRFDNELKLVSNEIQLSGYNTMLPYLEEVLSLNIRDVEELVEFTDGLSNVFNAYKDLIKKYTNLKSLSYSELFNLAGEFNLRGNEFATILALVEKLYLDSKTDKEKEFSFLCDTIEVSTKNAKERFANADDKMLKIREKRNSLKSLCTLLQTQIRLCTNIHHHCKNTCDWLNEKK